MLDIISYFKYFNKKQDKNRKILENMRDTSEKNIGIREFLLDKD